MAGEIQDLIAEERKGTGKGAARQARRENLVPGVVYGAGEEPVALNFNYFYLLKKLKAGRFLSSLFTLKVEGQADVQVVCRGVQRDVVKDQPVHVDLMRVRPNSRINLFVALDFINADKAPGIARGANLSVAQADVELSVLAGEIPASITVDLEGRKIGAEIKLSDLVLPAGVKVAAARDAVVASIVAPSGLIVSEEDME